MIQCGNADDKDENQSIPPGSATTASNSRFEIDQVIGAAVGKRILFNNNHHLHHSYANDVINPFFLQFNEPSKDVPDPSLGNHILQSDLVTPTIIKSLQSSSFPEIPASKTAREISTVITLTAPSSSTIDLSSFITITTTTTTTTKCTTPKDISKKFCLANKINNLMTLLTPEKVFANECINKTIDSGTLFGDERFRVLKPKNYGTSFSESSLNEPKLPNLKNGYVVPNLPDYLNGVKLFAQIDNTLRDSIIPNNHEILNLTRKEELIIKSNREPSKNLGDLSFDATDLLKSNNPGIDKMDLQLLEIPKSLLNMPVEPNDKVTSKHLLDIGEKQVARVKTLKSQKKLNANKPPTQNYLNKSKKQSSLDFKDVKICKSGMNIPKPNAKSQHLDQLGKGKNYPTSKLSTKNSALRVTKSCKAGKAKTATGPVKVKINRELRSLQADFFENPNILPSGSSVLKQLNASGEDTCKIKKSNNLKNSNNSLNSSKKPADTKNNKAAKSNITQNLIKSRPKFSEAGATNLNTQTNSNQESKDTLPFIPTFKRLSTDNKKPKKVVVTTSTMINPSNEYTKSINLIGKDVATKIGWDCSVCTYRNAKTAFVCAMCGTRKGTSTRKPKVNAALILAQQQTLSSASAVPTAKASTSSIDNKRISRKNCRFQIDSVASTDLSDVDQLEPERIKFEQLAATPSHSEISVIRKVLLLHTTSQTGKTSDIASSSSSCSSSSTTPSSSPLGGKRPMASAANFKTHQSQIRRGPALKKSFGLTATTTTTKRHSATIYSSTSTLSSSTSCSPTPRNPTIEGSFEQLKQLDSSTRHKTKDISLARRLSSNSCSTTLPIKKLRRASVESKCTKNSSHEVALHRKNVYASTATTNPPNPFATNFSYHNNNNPSNTRNNQNNNFKAGLFNGKSYSNNFYQNALPRYANHNKLETLSKCSTSSLSISSCVLSSPMMACTNSSNGLLRESLNNNFTELAGKSAYHFGRTPWHFGSTTTNVKSSLTNPFISYTNISTSLPSSFSTTSTTTAISSDAHYPNPSTSQIFNHSLIASSSNPHLQPRSTEFVPPPTCQFQQKLTSPYPIPSYPVDQNFYSFMESWRKYAETLNNQRYNSPPCTAFPPSDSTVTHLKMDSTAINTKILQPGNLPEKKGCSPVRARKHLMKYQLNLSNKLQQPQLDPRLCYAPHASQFSFPPNLIPPPSLKLPSKINRDTPSTYFLNMYHPSFNVYNINLVQQQSIGGPTFNLNSNINPFYWMTNPSFNHATGFPIASTTPETWGMTPPLPTLPPFRPDNFNHYFPIFSQAPTYFPPANTVLKGHSNNQFEPPAGLIATNSYPNHLTTDIFNSQRTTLDCYAKCYERFWGKLSTDRFLAQSFASPYLNGNSLSRQHLQRYEGVRNNHNRGNFSNLCDNRFPIGTLNFETRHLASNEVMEESPPESNQKFQGTSNDSKNLNNSKKLKIDENVENSILKIIIESPKKLSNNSPPASVTTSHRLSNQLTNDDNNKPATLRPTYKTLINHPNPTFYHQGSGSYIPKSCSSPHFQIPSYKIKINEVCQTNVVPGITCLYQASTKLIDDLSPTGQIFSFSQMTLDSPLKTTLLPTTKLLKTNPSNSLKVEEENEEATSFSSIDSEDERYLNEIRTDPFKFWSQYHSPILIPPEPLGTLSTNNLSTKLTTSLSPIINTNFISAVEALNTSLTNPLLQFDNFKNLTERMPDFLDNHVLPRKLVDRLDRVRSNKLGKSFFPSFHTKGVPPILANSLIHSNQIPVGTMDSRWIEKTPTPKMRTSINYLPSSLSTSSSQISDQLEMTPKLTASSINQCILQSISAVSNRPLSTSDSTLLASSDEMRSETPKNKTDGIDKLDLTLLQSIHSRDSSPPSNAIPAKTKKSNRGRKPKQKLSITNTLEGKTPTMTSNKGYDISFLISIPSHDCKFCPFQPDTGQEFEVCIGEISVKITEYQIKTTTSFVPTSPLLKIN